LHSRKTATRSEKENDSDAKIDHKSQVKGKTFYLFDLLLTQSIAASKLYLTSITKDSKD
jgi:hypothetical protein